MKIECWCRFISRPLSRSPLKGIPASSHVTTLNSYKMSLVVVVVSRWVAYAAIPTYPVGVVVPLAELAPTPTGSTAMYVALANVG